VAYPAQQSAHWRHLPQALRTQAGSGAALCSNAVQPQHQIGHGQFLRECRLLQKSGLKFNAQSAADTWI
jgi:hypothetical protein